MSRTRKHLRNLAINWGGHIAAMVVMFFLSPYVVGKLNAVDYGIWSLLTVLVGYMGIADLGVRASVGRHVALYLGKNDRQGVDETIRAGFAIFTLTGGLILLAGILLGWLFPLFFQGISPEHHSTVRLLLPLLAINIWLAAVAAIYSSVLTAHDRFDIARGIDIVVLFVRTISTVYALHAGWGLWGMAVAMILGDLSAMILNRLCSGMIYRGLRSYPFLYSRNRMNELFGYGFYSFIINISHKLIGQSDLIIVGLILSVSDVREYSIGAMLVYYTSPFIGMICGTFFPSVQKRVSGGDMTEVKTLFYQQLRISFSVGILAYIGLAFYSETFIKLWMFQEGFDLGAVYMSGLVMTILALSKLPVLYLDPCLSLLGAMGHVRFNAILSLFEALTNVFLSLLFVLVFGWGLAGVAAGTLAARLLVSACVVPIYVFVKTGFSFREFCVSSILPGVFAGVLFSVLCKIQIHFWTPENWIEFFVQVAISCIVWVFIVRLLLIDKGFFKKNRRQATMAGTV